LKHVIAVLTPENKRYRRKLALRNEERGGVQLNVTVPLQWGGEGKKNEK